MPWFLRKFLGRPWRPVQHSLLSIFFLRCSLGCWQIHVYTCMNIVLPLLVMFTVCGFIWWFIARWSLQGQLNETRIWTNSFYVFWWQWKDRHIVWLPMYFILDDFLCYMICAAKTKFFCRSVLIAHVYQTKRNIDCETECIRWVFERRLMFSKWCVILKYSCCLCNSCHHFWFWASARDYGPKVLKTFNCF